MRRLLAAAALCCLGTQVVSAQIIPRPSSAGRGLQPVPRDTTRDTTALVKWPAPDSVTQALLGKKDYMITRYQGDTAFFDAKRNTLDLLAAQKRRAVVERDSLRVVSDSGIYYSQAARKVVTGGHYVLSPGGGQADIIGHTRADYNLADRSASISNARLPVNNGDMWYLEAVLAKVQVDSTEAKSSTAWVRGGSMTSCDDSIPDFRFVFHEAKRAGNNTIVARPAVLYIRDIPVMWLPFIFSDSRSGRHSGILAPQFGVGDIIRNSPTYRRNVEHVGYYWALNDFMDFGAWLDWRSSAGATAGDPGWMRYNSDWQYKWIDRFLSGRVGLGYTTQGNGQTNLAISWGHQQEFSHDSRLNTSFNYVTSTALQRQNTFNPVSAIATIASQASYQTKMGPTSISLGATRKQYPGRDQVDQTFPTLSLSSTAISIAKWLSWTPSFSLNRADVFNMDQPGLVGAFTYRIDPSTGLRDSVPTKGRGSSTSSMSFDTPIQIFGKEFKNSFRINQQRNNFQQLVSIYDLNTGLVNENRIFAATYKTEIDWVPDFSLPPLAQNRFNLTPSVSLQNVDPGPFWVATQLTNGKYVSQSKRFTFGLSASPTLFGRFPGFGPFSALRHSITPSIGYNYAPATQVSDEYLLAIGRTRFGYLGNLKQNSLNFGLSQNIEAKVRSSTDTTGTDKGQTIRLLSITATPLNYDFERAKGKPRIKGLTTETFGYNLSSELLPGFDFSSSYSLFDGSTLSDSARFAPVLTNVSASFNIGREQNPLSVLTRLFGKAMPEPKKSPNPPAELRPQPDAALAAAVAAQPVAGDIRGGNRFIIPPSAGWRAQFTFSRSSPRQPHGDNVVDYDPRARCQLIANNDPFLLDVCLQRQRAAPTNDTPVASTTYGGTLYRIPPTTSLNSNVSFNLTPKWATSWQTTYDFERHEFASHIVSLQRELHDWRANFGFTQSPNGNFAFNFMISLKAEPDIKFDYNRATVGSRGTTF